MFKIKREILLHICSPSTRVQKRFKFTELNAVLSIQSYQAQRFWSNVAKNCSDFSLLREKIADNSINSWKECLSNKYAYEIIKENINSIGSYQCDGLTNILFSLSENYSQFAIDIIEFFHKLAWDWRFNFEEKINFGKLEIIKIYNTIPLETNITSVIYGINE